MWGAIARASRRWLTPDLPIATESVCRSLSIPEQLEFLAAVGGAIAELANPLNWEQFGTATPEECAEVMQGVIDAYYGQGDCNVVPAPYFDTPESADDEASEDTQQWYGEATDDPELTFVENIAIWGITAFIAYAGQIGGAIQFFTFAPKFVLAWKKSGIGGAIRVFVDGVDNGLIDTYDPSGGIVSAVFTGNPALESHQIVQVLESKPVGAPEFDPDDPDTASMQVIRKRLTEEEANMITDLRQQANSGQLEMFRSGVWENVPTAENVRKDGTVPMTSNLNIDRTVTGTSQQRALRGRRRGGTPGVNYGTTWDFEAETLAGDPEVLRTQARIASGWRVPNEGTQQGFLQFLSGKLGAFLEAWRYENNNSVVMQAWNGATPVIKQVVTGQRNANPALASLLTALANYGLITNSTTEGTLPITGATATGLPAGSTPTATIVGTILQLGIPAGATGATGAQGEQGETGSTGGTSPSDVENVGSIPNGECVDYDLVLAGNGQVVVPVVLQAGYTIEISNLSGAASDSHIDIDAGFPADVFPEWYCPNGQRYLLGGCAGDSGTDAGDPLPTANHMVLLASVNGALFDCSGEPTLEVGAGVNDVLVVFQLNDSDLTDNMGEVRFHIQVCNPAGVCATYEDSLTTGLGSLTHIPRIDVSNIYELHYPDANPTGAWSGGTLAGETGYVSSEFVTGLGNTVAVLVDLEDMCQVEEFSFDYNVNDSVGNATLWWGVYDDGMNLLDSDDTGVTGDGTVWQTAFKLNLDTNVRYLLFALASNNNAAAIRNLNVQVP